MKIQRVIATVKPHKTDVKEVQVIPIDYSDYSFDPPNRPHTTGLKTGLIAVVILCIAAIVFSVVQLRKPPAEVKKAQLEFDNIKAQQRLEDGRRQALKQQIQAKVSLAKGKLAALEQERQAIDSEFLALCKVPLDQAHLTMSRKTARSVLQSSAFSEALTRLLNTRLSQDSLARQRDSIWHVASNVSGGSIAHSYIETLDDVLTWTKDKHQVLQEQQSILDQLRQSSL